MKKHLLILVIVIISITFFSCQKENLNPPAISSIQIGNDIVQGRVGPPGECLPTEVILIAGQSINSGTVSVTNDLNFIYVTYTTANGWLLTQTHLFVGGCDLIPVNGPGNPIPGQFPYASVHNNITEYTYTVPISAIGIGNCACIAAHAVVVRLNAAGQVIEQQTGWGKGIRINPIGGNWGMKFNYCTCTPNP